jgi:hypothetical protein
MQNHMDSRDQCHETRFLFIGVEWCKIIFPFRRVPTNVRLLGSQPPVTPVKVPAGSGDNARFLAQTARANVARVRSNYNNAAKSIVESNAALLSVVDCVSELSTFGLGLATRGSLRLHVQQPLKTPQNQ